MSPLPRRRLLQLGLLASSLPVVANPAAKPAPPLRQLLAQRLRGEGIALAAARIAGQQLELAAEGRSGLGPQPLSADRHALEIGSISKTFTGLLLADALGRGHLKLDDAIEDRLGFALRDSDKRPLRFVDLATHRSGLPRLPANLGADRPDDPYAGYGDAALLEMLRAWQPLRGREAAFEYSNLGIGLLGWLLARDAALPFATLMRQRILLPLGLAEALPLAQGHDATGRPVPAWHFEDTLAGAGALRLSAAQLARYVQAALGLVEHPLRDAFALALQAHSPLGPQPGVQMGLGWMLLSQDGEPLATHDGATAGSAASLWLNLKRGRAGLVLANAQAGVGDLARHLMDERSPLRDPAAERASQQALQQRAALRLDAAQLRPLAGVYAASPQFKLVVRERGGQLFAQASGQGEFELFASGPRRFFARVAALEIEFAGAAGEPSELFIEQGGQRTRLQREGAEPVETVALDAATVAPLAGIYALNAGFKLRLRAERERLFAQATGQGEFELFPRSATQWFARVTPLEIRFDADGRALSLQQAGRELRFLRE